MIYAAIDIGSNAARLLIKKVDEKLCRRSVCSEKLLLLRVPLRLGFDVFASGEISPKRGENLVRYMKACKQLMRIYDVDRYRACATSAMRDAGNGPELIKRIKKSCDLDIEIINGSEEARIVYQNHLERSQDAGGNYLYVDVGGGSTELNFLSFGVLKMSRSFNIGTVRMLTGKVKDKTIESLREVCEALASEYDDINIIGSGGNINKLYRMAKIKDDEKKSMPVEELQRLYDMLAPLSVDERMERYSLKPDRADVIIPAARIFLDVAAWVGAKHIVVPVIGVADGIIDGMIASSDMKKNSSK